MTFFIADTGKNLNLISYHRPESGEYPSFDEMQDFIEANTPGPYRTGLVTSAWSIQEAIHSFFSKGGIIIPTLSLLISPLSQFQIAEFMINHLKMNLFWETTVSRARKIMTLPIKTQKLSPKSAIILFDQGFQRSVHASILAAQNLTPVIEENLKLKLKELGLDTPSPYMVSAALLREVAFKEYKAD